MLVPFTPPLRGKHRRTRRKPSAPPGPTALMLVSASFSAVTAILRLTFNKAVDVSGIVLDNFFVDDADSATQFVGVNATPVNASTVDLDMGEVQAQAYPDTRLRALEPTGIVAADNAQAWPGVADLLLPFP